MLMDVSGAHRVFSNAADHAIGMNGDAFLSNWASIWRWQRAYQYDFAARMGWSNSADYKSNNHHPIAIVNGSCGPAVMTVNFRLGDTVVLDARESWAPDDDGLKFGWFHYREVVQTLQGVIDKTSKNVTIETLTPNGSVASLEPKDNIVSASFEGEFDLVDADQLQTMHIVLSEDDDREMQLTSYRRIILEPTA